MARKTKDFSNMNTGRVCDSIAEAINETGEQDQEQSEHKKRINLALDPENHDFIRLLSGASGQNMTLLINNIIAAYREEHREIEEKAQDYIDFIKKHKW